MHHTAYACDDSCASGKVSSWLLHAPFAFVRIRACNSLSLCVAVGPTLCVVAAAVSRTLLRSCSRAAVLLELDCNLASAALLVARVCICGSTLGPGGVVAAGGTGVGAFTYATFLCMFFGLGVESRVTVFRTTPFAIHTCRDEIVGRVRDLAE